MVVAVAAAFAWLSSPPPPPRVLNTTQLTRDGIPKIEWSPMAPGSTLLGTQIARLFRLPSLAAKPRPFPLRLLM